MAAAIRDGDDPVIVAKVIVEAATGPKPKLRYPAGPLAGRASMLRRFAPAQVFDKQIRKLNQLTGQRLARPPRAHHFAPYLENPDRCLKNSKCSATTRHSRSTPRSTGAAHRWFRA